MTGIALTLPPALAARAGTDTVLAAEDADGVMEVYATADTLAAGERLRCFTVAEEAQIAALFADARGPVPSPPPSGRRVKGQTKVTHSRSAHVRCRPGRAW